VCKRRLQHCRDRERDLPRREPRKQHWKIAAPAALRQMRRQASSSLRPRRFDDCDVKANAGRAIRQLASPNDVSALRGYVVRFRRGPRCAAQCRSAQARPKPRSAGFALRGSVASTASAFTITTTTTSMDQSEVPWRIVARRRSGPGVYGQAQVANYTTSCCSIIAWSSCSSLWQWKT
jgi:hypothetical protein